MSITAADVWQARATLALMVASGIAGLGYQIVWTQQCAVWLGHESAAMLAVVAAFFGGLAVGALGLGQRIERSARPVRWYAACEALIAVWGLVLLVLIEPASGALLRLIGAQPAPAWQWVVAFIGTFVLLLPATAAMGATLPAMERVTTHLRAHLAEPGRLIAALYAANTFGAVLGVLATAYWLVPQFGLARTAGVCITLNLLCAAGALVALPKQSFLAPRNVPADSMQSRGVLARLALTGLLGIGDEVLVARVLGQVTEDTVYTFAMLLATYLVGSAAGAAAYQRWLQSQCNAALLGDRLLCALAVACLAGTASLWGAEHVKAWVLVGLGASMAAAVAAEAILAVLAFGLPTVVMGALFSHLSERACNAGLGFGRALGANTLGAAAAPLLFGVLMVPVLGPKLVLLGIAVGYLAMTTRPVWFTPCVLAPAATAAAVALFEAPLAFVDVPDGGRVISYRDGPMAAVSVVEDANGVARLRINNRQQEGSSSSGWADARQALLPLLLHPAPARALFLGLGTGMTASAAADDPTLQVDAVELLPEVIEASQHFRQASGASTPNTRVHLIAADARRFVRASAQTYDVIVSDNFHPARSGSGALYTVEHFQAVRQRLAPGGLFCQWLPLHQLDLDTLRSIVQSFMRAYPNGSAILASNSLETPVLGLVGHADDGARFDVGRLRGRLALAAWPTPPSAFGIEDEFALFGSFIAGPTALSAFAGRAPDNTDDHPVVAYHAPRITYAPDSQPKTRLLALLGELTLGPADLISTFAADGSGGAAWQRRMSAYWAARNRFIEAGSTVRPSADVRDMLAQVREPLLSVLRLSPDFRPAHDPLLKMANALAHIDEAAAMVLTRELALARQGGPQVK